MYGWIFRKVLIGPTWLRVIEALAIICGLVYLCFEYVYPWAQEYFNLAEAAV